MSRHPEGGYYKEIFRSEKLVDNDKSAMTSIYYLLEMKINQLSID